jgi:hypothetical protein
MSRFSDELGEATIAVRSPGAAVALSVTGRGEVNVRLDADRLYRHSDDSFARELQAVITAALRASRRAYVEARRDVFGTDRPDPAGEDDGDHESDR